MVFQICGHKWSGLDVCCFLVNLHSDHIYPSGAFSSSRVYCVKPVQGSDKSRDPSTFPIIIDAFLLRDIQICTSRLASPFLFLPVLPCLLFLYPELDNPIVMENLCYSASKGSDDAYDVSTSLTHRGTPRTSRLLRTRRHVISQSSFFVVFDGSGKPDERDSSNAQIRTLLEEQRQMIICEKIGQHELQAARVKEERRILREELWR